MTLHSQNLRKELKTLMIARETEDFLGREVDHLHHLIEEVSAPLAADGGSLARDVFGAMPQLGWERLTRLFLRTPSCAWHCPTEKK
jgi:hypothetical protein